MLLDYDILTINLKSDTRDTILNNLYHHHSFSLYIYLYNI